MKRSRNALASMAGKAPKPVPVPKSIPSKPLFSGAAAGRIKNLGRFAHPSKKK